MTYDSMDAVQRLIEHRDRVADQEQLLGIADAKLVAGEDAYINGETLAKAGRQASDPVVQRVFGLNFRDARAVGGRVGLSAAILGEWWRGCRYKVRVVDTTRRPYGPAQRRTGVLVEVGYRDNPYDGQEEWRTIELVVQARSLAPAWAEDAHNDLVRWDLERHPIRESR